MEKVLKYKHKAARGFTLIEVIVVALIVAVLAAVAIPIYTNYITSQKVKTVTNLANTGAAAGNSFWRRTGNDPTVAELNLFIADAAEYTVTINAGKVKVEDSDGNYKEIDYK